MNRNLLKIFALILSLVMCLSLLSSCQSNNEDQTAELDKIAEKIIKEYKDRPKIQNTLKELYEKYDYVDRIYTFYRVSNGGKVVDGKYVGGKWGVYRKATNSEMIPLEYDYIEDVIEIWEPYVEEEYYESWPMVIICKEGDFDSNGIYSGGKRGIYDPEEDKIVVECNYDYISDVWLDSAIVANNGKLEGEDYVGGDWGIVEYNTNKEIFSFNI